MLWIDRDELDLVQHFRMVSVSGLFAYALNQSGTPQKAPARISNLIRLQGAFYMFLGADAFRVMIFIYSVLDQHNL